MKELREELVKKLKKENKIKANIDNILVTAGSQEGLFTSLASTIDPGGQVLIPSPGYLAYIPAVELVSGHPVPIQLKEENNFDIHPEDIKKSITKKTKVLIINTPSNPTGQVFSRNLLEDIADIAVEHGLYIISDEAYEQLIYDGEHVSIGSLNGMKDYVISLFSFSKTYAMCGFRVGYVVGSEKLMEAMTKTIHYITLSPPHISQLLALKALKVAKSHITKMRDEYNRRRLYIVRRLNEIGLKTLMPKGAFYTFSNIKQFKMKSIDFSSKMLKKSKVAVMPGTEFGKFGEGYIRCSYATKMPEIKIGLDRIEKYVKTL